jgi:hypothetical protein
MVQPSGGRRWLCFEPIGNPRVSRYLERHRPEILTEFKAIVAATSLEERVKNASGEPAFLG